MRLFGCGFHNTPTPSSQGTLRVLLVLLHDFPEFLCDYHYGFCDVIPPNCIQLRNLILSAFPRNMRLPDPFTPNLKVKEKTSGLKIVQSERSVWPRVSIRHWLPSPAGGHAERDQHRPAHPHQLHGRHAFAVQEGSGLVPEDPIPRHVPVRAAQQPAGRN